MRIFVSLQFGDGGGMFPLAYTLVRSDGVARVNEGAGYDLGGDSRVPGCGSSVSAPLDCVGRLLARLFFRSTTTAPPRRRAQRRFRVKKSECGFISFASTSGVVLFGFDGVFHKRLGEGTIGD